MGDVDRRLSFEQCIDEGETDGLGFGSGDDGAEQSWLRARQFGVNLFPKAASAECEIDPALRLGKTDRMADLQSYRRILVTA